MVAQRGPLLTKRAGPLRRAHTESARAGHARHARSALSEFWNAWSACFPRSPSSLNGSHKITFVTEAAKVTFDVKYSGLRPQNPADELYDGRPASKRDCCFSEGRLVSVMKRPLSLKNRCFIGVAACHRVLDRDRGGIVLRGERRKRGMGFVIDHRHRRSTCAKDERCGNCDHGLGRHGRDSISR